MLLGHVKQKKHMGELGQQSHADTQLQSSPDKSRPKDNNDKDNKTKPLRHGSHDDLRQHLFVYGESLLLTRGLNNAFV